MFLDTNTKISCTYKAGANEVTRWFSGAERSEDHLVTSYFVPVLYVGCEATISLLLNRWEQYLHRVCLLKSSRWEQPARGLLASSPKTNKIDLLQPIIAPSKLSP